MNDSVKQTDQVSTYRAFFFFCLPEKAHGFDDSKRRHLFNRSTEEVIRFNELTAALQKGH